MTELQPGSIPLTEEEKTALGSIPNVSGYTRTASEGLYVESANGSKWLIKGDKVLRYPQVGEKPVENV
jgi:hypothetical protein